jgi:uncharacterized repeat protein (TIGR03803 family)
MQRRLSFTLLTAVFLTVGVLVATTSAFAAGPERVLYSFCSASNCADGQNSWAGLIFDSAGNLYGTTAAGGAGQYCYLGCGTVFKLAPGTDGQWTETVLYSFCSLSSCTDGASPYDALIFDSAGNLYGTTAAGGTGVCFSDGGEGCGTVFELTPGSNGQWTETVLHTFCSADNCTDGAYPYAGLIFDSAGNLYGTTADVPINSGTGCYPGGPGCGKVFQLRPGADGHWAYKALHNFKGKDGATPELGNLIFDASGNLYGTTSFGGRLSMCINGCGTVFELSPNANDEWTEKVLHSFDGKDGTSPLFGLVFDTAGNLYGTTYGGGRFAYGTVFQLTPGANGQWTEKVLYAFDSSDGADLGSGLIMDSTGNLYGSTNIGGANNLGTVFRLSPGAGGKWKETRYSFQTENDGAGPTGNLIFDHAGNLYGTTFGGGNRAPGCDGCGTVYEITP